MITLPNTISACHDEIKRLHEEITDWKFYSGEDRNSIRIIESQSKIATISRYFRDYAKVSALYARGGASILVVLSMCSNQRTSTKRLLNNILESIGSKSRDSDGFKVAEVYVCGARHAFKALGYDNPIETVWGTGYRLTASGHEFLERFK